MKPSNILLNGKQTLAKIADLGIARAAPAPDKSLSTTETMIRGTPGYMCPSYQRTKQYSAACDVYGYGIVTLQLAMGLASPDAAVRKALEACRAQEFPYEAVRDKCLPIDKSPEPLRRLV